MTDPIPREELARVGRSLCRRLGALAVHVMGETDSDFEYIDRRLGKKRPWARDMVYRLIDGDDISIRAVAELFFAMGHELRFEARAMPRPDDAEPEDAQREQRKAAQR